MAPSKRAALRVSSARSEPASGPQRLVDEPSTPPTPPLRLQLDASDLGARFRAARLARDLSLHDVANATKISVRAIEGLESNDARRLPGGIFSKAFVKTYASHLGLNPEECLALFLATFPEPAPPDELAAEAWRLHEATVATRRRDLTPALRALALVVAVAAASGALYWLLSGPGAPRPTQAAGVDEEAAQARVPAPPTASLDPALAPPPAADAPLPPVSADTATTTPTPTGGVPPAVSVSDQVATALASEQIEVNIEAVAPCWVRMMVDDEVAFARVMRVGERESRTATDHLVIDVGDAGAFRYSINGVPGRGLGRKGQVITARISRDNLATFFQQ